MRRRRKQVTSIHYAKPRFWGGGALTDILFPSCPPFFRGMEFLELYPALPPAERGEGDRGGYLAVAQNKVREGGGNGRRMVRPLVTTAAARSAKKHLSHSSSSLGWPILGLQRCACREGGRKKVCPHAKFTSFNCPLFLLLRYYSC